MEFDLDKLKLKTSDQLNDQEKEYITNNQDKLNDEDKEAYADFLNKDESVAETSSEETTTETENAEGEETATETAATTESATTESAVDEGFKFKSQEEAQEFVRKQLEESEKAKQAAIAAAPTKEEKERIDKEWKPTDWLHAKKVLGSELKDEIKKEIREEDEKERQRQVGIQLQKEWEALAKEKGLPSDKTPEGKTIHDSIVNFGIAAKKTTFKDAYAVWSKVPKEYGGGFEVAKVAEEKQDEKKQISEQKKVASKIGGQSSGSGTKPVTTAGKVEYDKLHKAKDTMALLKQEGYI